MSSSTLSVPAEEIVPFENVAAGISGLRILFTNVYGVRLPDRGWILIDTGLPLSTARIRSWAKDQFGGPPSAIVLTHGHFDHVGAVRDLADEWDVPVYAHPLEHPFLTGQQEYPPPNPHVGGGVMAVISPLYPRGPIDISHRLRPLEEEATEVLPGWRMIHTPGHTVGHVSFYREEDRTLLVGDAFCTTRQESFLSVATQKPELNGPPAYYTPDWSAAKESVEKLAALHPATVAPGHGQPMSGPDVTLRLHELAARFDEIATPPKS
ncbi:MAG TPA: MBL fold metallo-hydrolase [Acidobacteriaceae bacterium]|jgi:glyoxylase-like metal-dependent hydrolase (beta-lactamase superfamily II)|nr:MBL fold metallo-hydrolase [Acidobacteriaceae bacterium]